MSDLITRIQADLKTALKAKAELELSVLRMLKSDIQYELTKTGADTLPDAEVETIIKRAVKRRNDSAAEFRKGGREEAAEAEMKEAAVLEKYLPEKVSDEEIEKTVEKVFADVKPAGPSDMGKVMGRVMGAFKGKNIDGNKVRELVQKRLQG